MKENKKDTQLRSAEDILKNFIRKETEYLQACNRTNALGEITSNDFAEGVVRGMNKVLEEYVSQFRSVLPETDSIKVHATEDGKLYIKPADLFAQKKVQEVIEKASKESKETFNEEGWINAKQWLPEIGESVLVRTEFERITPLRKITDSETFVGYLNENGDLFQLPDDSSYGWEFDECVTHWMPLPNPPKP